MDALGVKENSRPTSKKNNSNGKKRGSKNKDDIKVVYISSPIKVKTSASEFRALVQELTGKDSDIAEMHFCRQDSSCRNVADAGETGDRYKKTAVECDDQSPACSDSVIEQFENDVVMPQVQDDMSFMDMMSSSLLHEPFGYGLAT